MSIDLKPYDTLEWLSSRRGWLVAGLFLALHAIACWHARELGVLLMRDDARYLILASSLGEGGYNDLFLTMGPAHSLYPPGFPALLYTWGSIFGDSFNSYIVFNIILSTSALGMLFASVKRIWGPFIALLCLTPLCVNPLLIERAGGLRSETAYMFFSVAALWALSRARPATQTLIVSALAALIATLTRTIGVTLLAAIVILWLNQRRYKAVAIFACVSLVSLGVWLAWTVVAPQQHPGSNYLGDFTSTGVKPPDWLAIIWERTGVRVARYFSTALPWSVAMPTVPGTPIDNAVSSLAIVFSLLAGLLVLFKRWKVTALYLMLYAAALLAWPFMLARFLEPVLPLLVLAIVLGAGALVARVRPRWATPTIVIVGLMLTVSGVVRSAPRLATQMSCGPLDLAEPPECLSPQQSSFLRSVHYISETTDSDDVFINQMPETLYYYSGRRSIDPAFAISVRPQSFLDYLVEQGVDWALLTPGAARLASFLRAHCTELDVERIFDRRTIMFRIPLESGTEPVRPDRETAESCVALDDYLSDYARDAEGLAIE